MKICSKCKVSKEIEKFYKNPNTGKVRCDCRDCVQKYRSEYESRLENKARKVIYNLNWRSKDPTRIRKSNKNARKNNLKRNFNLSLDDYNAMFQSQEGQCKICRTHQKDLKISLAVDHCHTTGKIRGLLCNKCNTALGLSGDNLEILQNMIDYLKS